MSADCNHLKAGQFYGSVPRKRSISTSILSEVVHETRVSLPEHSHELAFFTLVVDGRYSERYARKSFEYGPLTVLWHPSGIEHKDEVGNKGARFFGIEISVSGLGLLKDAGGVPADFHEKGGPLVWLACRLYDEFRNWDECSGLIAEGLTLEMLGSSARRNGAPKAKPPRWLAKVEQRLNDDFSINPSSEELAEVAGVHPVHLAAVFRKFHEKTMGEYLQERRVSVAGEMLREQGNPIADIAYACGFSDQSHLTRVFKRHTGMTPGRFRSSMAG